MDYDTARFVSECEAAERLDPGSNNPEAGLTLDEVEAIFWRVAYPSSKPGKLPRDILMGLVNTLEQEGVRVWYEG